MTEVNKDIYNITLIYFKYFKVWCGVEIVTARLKAHFLHLEFPSFHIPHERHFFLLFTTLDLLS